MPVYLYTAPAAAGKTTYILHRAREAAQGLTTTPRVVVPGHLQVRALRRRLAEAGGALGVRVLTFDRLYAECLNAAGEVYTELSEPVQYRLIRAVVDELPLDHYAPLADRPGFIQILEHLVRELKAARVVPETFTRAVAELGDEPRLRDLARIYAAYQSRLQIQGWADRAGLGWLAVEALEERAPHVARDWPLVLVDGFDNLTEVQLALLRVLAGRVGELIVTLTGATGEDRPLAHRRFEQTRQRLEEALGIQAIPLPESASHAAPTLAHLETALFRSSAIGVEAAGAVDLVAAPDRAAEVRAALRWLKARLLDDGLRPGEVALLARDVAPYRPFIQQTAAEFGLPVRLVDGLPLRANPAVAALLDLLRLMRPSTTAAAEPALPCRLVVEAWRSPYFDWSTRLTADGDVSIGIAPGDADTLDAVARWGRVIGSLAQWMEVLDALVALAPAPTGTDDEERGRPADVPIGSAAQALRLKFDRFVQRLTPPLGEHSYRDFVGWLEALIGPDPTAGSPRYPRPPEPTALQVVTQARAAPEPIAERDVAALQALKDVLRGLVWAEEALGTNATVDYARFLDELAGAVDATFYRLPVRPDRDEIVVADVVQARGVPFRAVAVLGLAEGEFPATLGEDPFLRDADRRRLQSLGLPLELSTASAEHEFFYETVTRPRDRLLLTRPRLADNGADWSPSPFWEEVRRLVDIAPERLTSESVPPPAQVASWSELLESLAAHPGHDDVRDWIQQAEPARLAALDAAVGILRLRHAHGQGPYDGDLHPWADEFVSRFGPAHTWSASRLEAYRACPFWFFVGHVLGLEPRAEPTEGLDARQLGTLYHRILEHVYQAVADPTDLDQLLAALPAVAARLLDEAPRREGFRETAWWAQTRAEIEENVRRSLVALAELPGKFTPLQHEAVFGLQGQPPLVVRDGGDAFRLRGFIDRVDRDPAGRVRVIDYKTGGPYAFTNKAVVEGKKLQLPLYALAARDALDLGEPVEGFYWHVRHAQTSGFTLAGFDGGPTAVLDVAVEKAWEAVRSARAGHFVPHPPDGGCPSYCPVVAFCWHRQAGFGG